MTSFIADVRRKCFKAVNFVLGAVDAIKAQKMLIKQLFDSHFSQKIFAACFECGPSLHKKPFWLAIKFRCIASVKLFSCSANYYICETKKWVREKWLWNEVFVLNRISQVCHQNGCNAFQTSLGHTTDANFEALTAQLECRKICFSRLESHETFANRQ